MAQLVCSHHPSPAPSMGGRAHRGIFALLSHTEAQEFIHTTEQQLPAWQEGCPDACWDKDRAQAVLSQGSHIGAMLQGPQGVCCSPGPGLRSALSDGFEFQLNNLTTGCLYLHYWIEGLKWLKPGVNPVLRRLRNNLVFIDGAHVPPFPPKKVKMVKTNRSLLGRENGGLRAQVRCALSVSQVLEAERTDAGSRANPGSGTQWELHAASSGDL